MRTTTYLAKSAARAWRYRGIRYRRPRPSPRIHWRKLEHLRWKAEGLGVDSKGRIVCQACGDLHTNGHQCPFP